MNPPANPYDFFKSWYDDALNTDMVEPRAMAIATATVDAKPSVRVVLLNGFDQNGFKFYTNYESRKGNEIRQNPHAAATIFWNKLERQVRFEGEIEKLTAEESDAYFNKRPRGSRISAIASAQSQIVESREYLEQQVDGVAAKYQDADIPRPDYWGGYRIKAEKIEFWQGRPNRTHDRFLYLHADNVWQSVRLSP